MLILVSGGSGSGKSAFAEDLIVSSGLETKIYVATMQVWDAEGQARVDRHRAMRAGKGFATLECPVNLAEADVSQGCALLLEDLTNLAANEWFGGDRSGAEERVLAGLRELKDHTALTVVVANELFSDGIAYDEETADYLACLARLNRAAAQMADRVYEVVCGIPVRWKGEGE